MDNDQKIVNAFSLNLEDMSDNNNTGKGGRSTSAVSENKEDDVTRDNTTEQYYRAGAGDINQKVIHMVYDKFDQYNDHTQLLPSDHKGKGNNSGKQHSKLQSTNDTSNSKCENSAASDNDNNDRDIDRNDKSDYDVDSVQKLFVDPEDTSDQPAYRIFLEMVIPFLFAGFGTVFAGILLDHVQVVISI